MAKQQKTKVSYSSGGKNITKTIDPKTKSYVDSVSKKMQNSLSVSQKAANKVGASISAAYAGKKATKKN